MQVKISFLDKNNKLQNLEIQDERNYFSICGDNGQNRDFEPASEAQQFIMDTWNAYHLKTLPEGHEALILAAIDTITGEEEEKRSETVNKIPFGELVELIEAEHPDGIDMDEAAKLASIGCFFDLSLDEVLELDPNETEKDIQGITYYIGTDEEMDELATKYIEDSAWAFNASFLADMTDLPIEVFEALSDKFEDSNDAVVRLIEKTCGMEDFVSAAISADGRGHFLNSYDGEEDEYSAGNGWPTIYFCRQ
jgi:hypothetical protein